MIESGEVVSWTVGNQLDPWLTSCCVCGGDTDLHKCAGCPRVFHLRCLNKKNCLVYLSSIENEESPKLFCSACRQSVEDDEVSREEVENQVALILERCKSFPSGHPASILADTLQVLLKRSKHFPNLGYQYGGPAQKGAPECFRDLRSLQVDKSHRLVSLEEGLKELNRKRNKESCTALLEISKETPKLPLICKKLQDALPMPQSRNYVNMFIRDGVCTPPVCKISRLLALELKNYILCRFNQHVNNINQRNLKRQLVEGGFKELRLNYYMRFEIALDEIKKDARFQEIVGRSAQWTRFVTHILGEEYELTEVICQITRPGAPAQSAYSDEQCERINPRGKALPPYAITVFIPLVDLVAGAQGWNGAFEFHIGSHKDESNSNTKVVLALSQGQGALVDFRLKYRCLENSSAHETFVVSLIYVRKGFKISGEPDLQSKPHLPKQKPTCLVQSHLAAQKLQKHKMVKTQHVHNPVEALQGSQKPQSNVQKNTGGVKSGTLRRYQHLGYNTSTPQKEINNT
eukprot:TRINITY_DN6983_c0_g1_i10.p1 TRINITY_DN6983_c0_g1~~TRINITY_DN6983_c0_g1_i10.p1  ORF type:complete len:518 (-),score=38.72 TRINITY_DN6983_c0_g1_i10:885-2438(-)